MKVYHLNIILFAVVKKMRRSANSCPNPPPKKNRGKTVRKDVGLRNIREGRLLSPRTSLNQVALSFPALSSSTLRTNNLLYSRY